MFSGWQDHSTDLILGVGKGHQLATGISALGFCISFRTPTPRRRFAQHEMGLQKIERSETYWRETHSAIVDLSVFVT